MKKIFILFSLLLGVLSAWAYDVELDGIVYNLDKENKTASVASYSYKGAVVIPETISVDGKAYTVTSLGENCFSGCWGLKSITIPNSVTRIGEYCFYFWINEPLSFHRLPPVWHYCVSRSHETPYMAIMLRKHNHKELPYCWAIINIAGYQFLFILPFCAKDKYKFVGKGRVQFFLDGLKNIMPNITLQPVNLNSITLVSLKINANINISPECVEGRDYSFINLQNQPKG